MLLLDFPLRLVEQEIAETTEKSLALFLFHPSQLPLLPPVPTTLSP
jgi:hypothetical protein